MSRSTEPFHPYRRHSRFDVGLPGHSWLDSLTFFSDEMAQLMSFSLHKRLDYQKELKAASLIQSAL